MFSICEVPDVSPKRLLHINSCISYVLVTIHCLLCLPPQPLLCVDVSSCKKVDEFDGVVNHEVVVAQAGEVVVGPQSVDHDYGSRSHIGLGERLQS